MKIAVFDPVVTSTNPSGSCDKRIIEGLRSEHKFCLFSAETDVRPDVDVDVVRVPIIARPLILSLVSYMCAATVIFLLKRITRRFKFDVIQNVEGNMLFGHICYAHFCHRAYLRWYHHKAHRRGLRWYLAWCNHVAHALTEPFVYRRARLVVVPSNGLAQELRKFFPSVKAKLRVIPNAVDVEALRIPTNFSIRNFKVTLFGRPDTLVACFIALGHFERKGLSLLLDALAEVKDCDIHLLVVGGQADTIATYQHYVDKVSLAGRVVFAGTQKDVRPFLWASDMFVLPSLYETFSLATFEAAAAGVPAIVTRFHGVDEFLRDGINGISVEPTVSSVADGLRRLMKMSAEARRSMGEHARISVQRYSIENFVASWRAVYGELAQPENSGNATTVSAPKHEGVRH